MTLINEVIIPENLKYCDCPIQKLNAAVA